MLLVLDIILESIYYIISMKAIFCIVATQCIIVYYWIWKPQNNALINHKYINYVSKKGQCHANPTTMVAMSMDIKMLFVIFFINYKLLKNSHKGLNLY